IRVKQWRSQICDLTELSNTPCAQLSWCHSAAAVARMQICGLLQMIAGNLDAIPMLTSAGRALLAL
ncbi:unnamed protein product, partial [Ceratitis capitata]